MSGKSITVWNSTEGIIKFGINKVLIYPNETRVFDAAEAADHGFIDGKLVILSEESPKRRKKEVIEPVEPVIEEIPAEEDNVVLEEIQEIASVETVEDSILAE
jgi:hypothetical protein